VSTNVNSTGLVYCLQHWVVVLQQVTEG